MAKKKSKKTSKKKSSKKSKKKQAQREMVVVTSKVKGYIRNQDLLTSGEVPAALNELVHDLLDKAIDRAKENGRSTVRPQDL